MLLKLALAIAGLYLYDKASGPSTVQPLNSTQVPPQSDLSQIIATIQQVNPPMFPNLPALRLDQGGSTGAPQSGSAGPVTVPSGFSGWPQTIHLR